MVKAADIEASNSAFFSTKAASNLTAVFVGATNGIGLGALRAFTKYTSGASPTIYIVGRSQKNLDTIIESLSAINATAKLIPIIANDLTLIKDAQSAANQILASASAVDFLITTPGYISFTRDESPEGLDRVQAIRYYSRLRFVLTLEPLLQKSASPRIVTVLGGGGEGKLWPEDWTLKNHYNIPNAGSAACSMISLSLEEFVKRPGNDKVRAVHAAPGLVGGTTLKWENFPKWGQLLVNWLVTPFLNRFGYSIEEAGERVLYAATSETLPSRAEKKTEGVEKGSDGKEGSGVYLLKGNSDAVPGNKTLTQFRAENMGEKVWAHTLEKFEEVERS